MRRLRAPALLLTALALLTATACSRAERAPEAPAAPAAGGVAQELRLGYFPNVTHAPAIIGVEQPSGPRAHRPAGSPRRSSG
jgi:NitT/TauT family transport system substrate-binding protein